MTCLINIIFIGINLTKIRESRLNRVRGSLGDAVLVHSNDMPKPSSGA